MCVCMCVCVCACRAEFTAKCDERPKQHWTSESIQQQRKASACSIMCRQLVILFISCCSCSHLQCHVSGKSSCERWVDCSPSQTDHDANVHVWRKVSLHVFHIFHVCSDWVDVRAKLDTFPNLPAFIAVNRYILIVVWTCLVIVVIIASL